MTDNNEYNIRKYNQQYKKNAEEAIDLILLNTVGSTEDDFKDYTRESLDWSWDNITNQ
jgi:hypothetical protein